MLVEKESSVGEPAAVTSKPSARGRLPRPDSSVRRASRLSLHLRPTILIWTTGVALLLYATLQGNATTAGARAAAPYCSLGVLQRNQPLLRPRPRSFYSVDALNPDVVAYHGKYLMYFSGNSVSSTIQPRWVTGLAVASRPMGPFRVDARFRGHYLNGGTTLWRGRLWHLVEVVPGTVNELATSVDGRTWHHVAWLPTFVSNGVKVAGADFSLFVEHGELVASMFLVHTRPLGSAFALGRVHFDGRRWHGFETVLRRDASLPYEGYDVGEPEIFDTAAGETAMLYGATAADNVRSIAMAVLRQGRWVRCGNNPVIRAGVPWAHTIAIDPSVLRIGPVTYVYYGGASSTGLGSNLSGAIGVARFVDRYRSFGRVALR